MRTIAWGVVASSIAFTSACYRTTALPVFDDVAADTTRASVDSAVANGSDAVAVPDGTPISMPAAPVPTYVVMQLGTDIGSPGQGRGGFDLDGLASTESDLDGCRHADYVSGGEDENIPSGCMRDDPACRGPVDDSFWALSGLLNAAAPTIDTTGLEPAPVERYEQVIMVRLLGLDDYANDEDVTALIYRAYPTFSEHCDDSRGVVDQEYVIARTSLESGATSVDQARVRIPARIVDRRIRIRGRPEQSVAFLMGDGVHAIRFDTALHAISMSWDFYMADDIYGYNGGWGGWIPGADLRDGIAAAYPGQRDAIESAVATVVDIAIGGVCVQGAGHPMTLGGVSLAGGIRMVRARVRALDAVVESQIPGTCGYHAP